MKVSYPNTFARGQKLVRYLLVFALAAGVAGFLLFPGNSSQQAVCVILSAALMAAAIVCMVRLCRCPRCGRRIVGGVLVLETCPRCKCNLYTGDKVKKGRKK